MGKYTSEADKGAFLVYLGLGYTLRKAAKLAGLMKSTAFDIRKRAGEIKLHYTENNLPPPTRQQQLAIRPKIGRPPALTELDKDAIFAACTKDADSQERRRHLVAEELGFQFSQQTIEKAMCKRRLDRPKTTKKLFLTDIQKAQHYKLALSQKD